MDFKATALNEGAEAKLALQVNSAKANELSKEIFDMKDAIHQLKACSHSESARVRKYCEGEKMI